MILACSKEEKAKINFNDCDPLVGKEILSEAERSNTCIYLLVYLYQDEIYFTCECCVCDKYSIASNCAGIPLCDYTENCMEDFNKNAEYLFSVQEL